MATAIDTTMLASRLRLALGHLIRRLRAERHRFSLSQASVLGRLDRTGPSSIGDLAVAERVRPQSMTQIVDDLEADGLIERRADPSDGRRTLVELTDRGLQTLNEDRREREGWLARTIAEDLTPREQRLLAEVLPLLERLAED
ncbi:MAG TPA: MarR family transcriptional regulator [Solirubrobacteraceae bacterium]|jgi:DNA-binding MarR family transcriptional regulator|nr:MarR family transcriptional regulator [Solirubrobacteraceae bacterium]